MVKIIISLTFMLIETLVFTNEKEILHSLSTKLKGITHGLLEDALLDVPKIIPKYGYPVEIHEVQTKDGYLVTMHRIPGTNISSNGEGSGIPVLIMHGLHGSSAIWIINGPKSGLGYLLADKGYDVWLGNARGNYYSRKHISLNPNSDIKFWMFSWHEIGYYDLPACIDYILKSTGKKKIQYIGHSQGSSAFYVMASTKPDYNKKISLMQSLAPIAYLSNIKWPLFKFVASLHPTFEGIFESIGTYEFSVGKNLKRMLVKHICQKDSKMLPICSGILFLAGGGYNPTQLNTTMLPVYIGHAPAGSSLRQHIHYSQIYTSKKFRQYDHGKVSNMAFYGKPSPPEYNLKKITAPVALYWSDMDLLAVQEDIDMLNCQLSNAVRKFRVPVKAFSHLDFVFGIEVKTLLYDFMLDFMKSY